MPSAQWTRQTPAEINALFDQQRRADPFGLRLHEWAAMIACFSAALPTAFVTWGALPLILVWLVRMWTHHRILGPLWWDSTARAAAAWSAWLLLSLLWSSNPRAGLEEAHVLAFLLLIPAMYPVIDRARWLLGALGAGFMLGLSVQGLHALDVALNTHWINWGRLPGRISGWWDPVVGGSLLTSFLGVALAIAATATTNVRRAASGFVVLAALAGVIATGTRGAWIGGALTLGVGVLVLLWCRAFARAGGHLTARRRAAIAGALALACAGIVGASALAVWTVPSLRARLDEGRQEVRRTLDQADYTTFTGARLAMWEWALAAWRCHPIVGVGAGGYQAWVREQTTLALQNELDASLGAGLGSGANAGASASASPPHVKPCLPPEKLGPIIIDEPVLIPENAPRTERARPTFREIVHAHAHGLWPHVAATTGTVGLGLLAWLLLAPILHPVVRPFVRARRAGEPQSAATAAADPIPLVCAMGLVGLLAAGLFDSISVNQQTWYLASVLLALGVKAGAPVRVRGVRVGGAA